MGSNTVSLNFPACTLFDADGSQLGRAATVVSPLPGHAHPRQTQAETEQPSIHVCSRDCVLKIALRIFLGSRLIDCSTTC